MKSFKQFINEGSLGLKRILRKVKTASRNIMQSPTSNEYQHLLNILGPMTPRLPNIPTTELSKKRDQYIKRAKNMNKREITWDNFRRAAALGHNMKIVGDELNAAKAIKKHYKYSDMYRITTPPEVN